MRGKRKKEWLGLLRAGYGKEEKILWYFKVCVRKEKNGNLWADTGEIGNKTLLGTSRTAREEKKEWLGILRAG